MKKPLVVYKASAGSGKTFRLAVEYIKLVIENPLAYRNILAVTFTNKATEEMKMRILGQLYGIWKLDKDSESYICCVTQELQISREYASQRAHEALSNLIHNYNYFRVETIDSFFQSVLRNLARELDLTANLHVGLNDKMVEQQAVDELIESLEANSVELQWILNYIGENIDEDKGWNVIGQIKQFGENIFKDIYKSSGQALNKKLSQKDFFTTFTSRLREIRAKSKSEMEDVASNFFKLLDEHGYSITDFANGSSGVCGYFLKLQKGKYDDADLLGARVTQALNDAKSWLKKADQNPSSPLFQFIESTLLPLLQSSEAQRPKRLKLYKSADITLKHMNQLRLLNSIDMMVRNLNKEANRFLLSDTQALLNSLIKDTDSPFIFEKIGTQLEHIMIDEFQDTSTIQWENFKVLLKECLSHAGSHDLIVGDVKQSIYRWRSGDWRLLNEIENEFPSSQIDVQPLRCNRRSAVRVIRFNNAFFTHASKHEYAMLNDENPAEAPLLLKAYDQLTQFPPEEKVAEDRGYIHIELLPQNGYQQTTMEKLVQTVDDLLAHGIPTSHIAIIVRSNRTIQNIANHFMQERPSVKLVSEEAFRLDSSSAVNIIIDALHLLTHPDDSLTRAQLVKAYQQQVLGCQEPESRLLLRGVNLDTLLPRPYVEQFDTLIALPATDLVEKIYSLFNLQVLHGQSAYVCAFFDLLHSYMEEHVADIEDFLVDWNDNLHENTIQSDEVDGIRLITIHKSKGLEFKHVIMPFCDWSLNKGSLLWCRPDESLPTFNELPLIPVDYNAKQMKGTIYEADYLHDHLQTTVDNLNLLYVAFTRAEESLTVFGRRGAAASRSMLIEQSLQEVTADLPGSILQGADGDKSEPITFEYGAQKHQLMVHHPSLLSPQEKPDETARNVFTTPPMPRPLTVETFPKHVEFRQSNQSRDFVALSGTGDEEEQRKSYMQIGSILHKLFSTIRTKEDIPNAIRQLESDGVLYDQDISPEKLMRLLSKRLNNPRVANWFSNRWQLFNECTILTCDPTTGKVIQQRPDRVMTDGKEMIVVDFKFGSPRPDLLEEYFSQVSRYKSLLSDMGYSSIRGFLWFVYSNQIIPVEA
ncbi:MAG: UvrD-helicase domain-containing protein [Prevotella sp.]|nr:UvrD-helicase domain-containing protein [Prevotella sp.]